MGNIAAISKQSCSWQSSGKQYYVHPSPSLLGHRLTHTCLSCHYWDISFLKAKVTGKATHQWLHCTVLLQEPRVSGGTVANFDCNCERLPLSWCSGAVWTQSWPIRWSHRIDSRRWKWNESYWCAWAVSWGETGSKMGDSLVRWSEPPLLSMHYCISKLSKLMQHATSVQ